MALPTLWEMTHTDNLHEYGIHTEDTTHRIHVDIDGGCVFSFLTEEGVNALPDPVSIVTSDDWECGDYYLVSPKWLVKRNPEWEGQATSRGIRIWWEDIAYCQQVEIPSKTIEWAKKQNAETTSKKGRLGLRIVDEMLKRGLIPIALKCAEIIDRKEQIIGIDISSEPMKIQVKYDKGCKDRGLFLQTHEWNPFNDF